MARFRSWIRTSSENRTFKQKLHVSFIYLLNHKNTDNLYKTKSQIIIFTRTVYNFCKLKVLYTVQILILNN